MTEKEKRRQMDKASKLRPRPVLLPSGAWRCQVMVGGQRQSVTGSTPEEANARALALKEGLAQQRQKEEDERAGNIRLKDAIELHIKRKSNILSPSTLNGYEEIVRNRFKGLMNKRVSRIGETQLQEAVNEEAERVSAKTIKNALTLIIPVIEEYHPVNKKKIVLPKRVRREHTFLEAEDMVNLFDAIRGNLVEIPVLLAMWLGLRRSEIMGLCWDCIDFEQKRVIIRRAYIKQPGKGYILRDSTKTEGSYRVLDCPDYILERLNETRPTTGRAVCSSSTRIRFTRT